MTPDKIQRASELLETLNTARLDYEAARRAPCLMVMFGTMPGHKAVKGSELFDDIQSSIIAQLTGDIDRMERELRSLGVELPEPDFVNMAEDRPEPAPEAASHSAEAEARQDRQA